MYIFVGHSFVRKWMLLTNPGDKGADEEQAVSNREKAHWKLDINKNTVRVIATLREQTNFAS